LEFFVLDLQLNLVDLQFVEQALGVSVAPRCDRVRVLLSQAVFGAAAQFSRCG
jgi:hypothetical protein